MVAIQIEDKIKDFIAKNLVYDPNGYSYPDDASFLREGIVDSLGIMDLVAFLQSEFCITVETQDITPENFDSVMKLAGFVRSKTGAATPK
jgi:acyl carrier protein